MTTRRDRIARWSLGFSIALIVNLLLLGILALQVPLTRWLIPTEPRAMTVKLERLGRPAVAKPAPRPLVPAPATRTGPPIPSPLSAPSPPIQSAPAASPASTQAGAADAQAPPPVPPDFAEAARVGALLRKMRACASVFDRKQREQMGCPLGRDEEGPEVQGISAADRLAFDAEKRRAADLIETSRRMQQHTFAPQGSAIRLGCRYSGGKLHCGTY